MDIPPSFAIFWNLILSHISDTDVCKAIKRLKPSKYLGLDNSPGFVKKGCSVIFYSYSKKYI
jgi:hypothetical protein